MCRSGLANPSLHPAGSGLRFYPVAGGGCACDATRAQHSAALACVGAASGEWKEARCMQGEEGVRFGRRIGVPLGRSAGCGRGRKAERW